MVKQRFTRIDVSNADTIASVKEKMINVRLGPDDEERLARLCEHFALSTSSVVRMLLKQAADALPEPKKSAPKK
jgi:hypothetical protein